MDRSGFVCKVYLEGMVRELGRKLGEWGMRVKEKEVYNG